VGAEDQAPAVGDCLAIEFVALQRLGFWLFSNLNGSWHFFLDNRTMKRKFFGAIITIAILTTLSADVMAQKEEAKAEQKTESDSARQAEEKVIHNDGSWSHERSDSDSRDERAAPPDSAPPTQAIPNLCKSDNPPVWCTKFLHIRPRRGSPE